MKKTRFDYPINEEISLREYLLKFKLAKSKIYKLFLDKEVLVNNKFENENFILKKGNIVSILLNENIDYKPEDYPLDILYEDDYYLIINKPSGIIIHDDDKNKTGTLSNYVAGYYKKKGLNINVRFCHRLDKDTTGVIVVCKDILCHSYMNHYISLHEIKREYRCLCQGIPKNNSMRLEFKMGSSRHDSKKMVITNNGKDAITNYEVLYKYKGYSLLRVILETGRTHQIRLHLSHIGNPLLGDTLYGGQTRYINRVALHSYKISFIHPVTNKTIEVVKDVPEDMKNLMR